MGVKGREQATFKLGSPNLSVHLANFTRSINRILIVPSRHASFLAPRGAGRHTPDPALAPQAWVLHPPPRPRRVPAQPPPGRLRQQAPPGRKIVFLGCPAPRGRCAQPARQPPGGVRAASPASPGGPRPPTGRRVSADCSAGFRERVPAPARPPRPRRPEGATPRSSPVPRLRGPPAPPVLGTSREAPPGFRPPGQRPQSPASSTADGQGAGAHGPAPCGPERSGAPRARPDASPGRSPPSTPQPARLSAPGSARSRPLLTCDAPRPPAHRPDRLCTPEVTSPGRPRPRPRRTPDWLLTQGLEVDHPGASREGAALSFLPQAPATALWDCVRAGVEDRQPEPAGPPGSSSVAWPLGGRG